jgi:hypothetical protein
MATNGPLSTTITYCRVRFLTMSLVRRARSPAWLRIMPLNAGGHVRGWSEYRTSPRSTGPFFDRRQQRSRLVFRQRVDEVAQLVPGGHGSPRVRDDAIFSPRSSHGQTRPSKGCDQRRI